MKKWDDGVGLESIVLKLTQAARPYVPFTSLRTVGRLLCPAVRSVLDVGCGEGVPIRFLRRPGHNRVVGVDIFEPYLKECQAARFYDELIQADVRFLPFRPKSFDVVLCLEVLEHLDRKEGLRLINALEQIARYQVIISTPVGVFHQEEYDGNPYQEHRYVWEPGELRQLGYRVIGHGMRGLAGWAGIQSPLPRLLRPLADVV